MFIIVCNENCAYILFLVFLSVIVNMHIYIFITHFYRLLITTNQVGDMASSLHHIHSRCIFKYSLFMLACLRITSRLNHELKSFHSNTTEINYVNNKATKTNSIVQHITYTALSGRLSHSSNASDPTVPLVY